MIITKLISVLTNSQKKKFAVFCVDRVIDLYRKVDETEDLSIIDKSILKGNAFDYLIAIYNQARNNNLDTKKAEDLIKKCDPLILDTEEMFDNTVNNQVAQLVAQSIDYLLRYQLTKDDKYILYCSSNTIEIVNQLKSDEFYKKEIVGDSKLDCYVQSFIKDEFAIQKQAINYLKNNKSLEELTSKNKIGKL